MNISKNHEAIEAADRLRDQGLLDDAEAIYEQLIEQAPDFATAHYKLGVLRGRRQQLAESEQAYRTALALFPEYPEAANNLGLLLVESKGRTAPESLHEAERLFLVALAERPDYPEAHLNLGRLLLGARRFLEARYHCLRAIDLRPDNAPAFYTLGNTYRQEDRPTEALAALEQAVILAPGMSEAWNLLATCHLSLSHVHEAIAYFRRAIEAEPEALNPRKNIALAVNYVTVEKGEMLAAHVELADQMRKAVGPPSSPQVYPLASPDKRLRIGFVSADFRTHSVSFFMMSLLKELDHRNFEYHAFYTSREEDERSLIFRSLFHYWHRVDTLSTGALALEVQKHRIDILIDLSGHTTNSRTEMFVLRPAPVQMAWLGYPNTTGLSEIQYRLTDQWADPIGVDDGFHSETLIRMPRSFLCYSPPTDAPAVAQAPVLSNGYVTFGSFNQRTKISAECVALWSQVLKAVPNSRLLLKSVFGFGQEVMKRSLLEEFSLHGIDSSRLTLLGREAGLQDHLSRYSLIDVALDTVPYNGTTTTCEALWMGVPVVTLAGDRHVSRVGVSLLNNAGLPDLIATDQDEFVRIAVALVSSPEKLMALREGMRDRLVSSPLLDARAMARDLENVWRKVWQDYCAVTPLEVGALPHVPESSYRLWLGGDQAHEDWTSVSLNGEGVGDVGGSLTNLSAFGDGSCDAIYCSHLLQRLATAEVLDALQEMHRVLKVGGHLYLSVPDLDELTALFSSEDFSKSKKFLFMRHMFGMQVDEHDFNRTGLGFDFLADCLQDVGFSELEHVESFGFFNDKSEQRIEGMLVSLNLIVVK